MNIYAAVRAAQQMPGTTVAGRQRRAGPDPVADPARRDRPAGGTISSQTVTPVQRRATERPRSPAPTATLGQPTQIGQTVTEPVSAPDPSLPVPAAGRAGRQPDHLHGADGARPARRRHDLPRPGQRHDLVVHADRSARPAGPDLLRLRHAVHPGRADRHHARTSSTSRSPTPTPGTWTAKILWANGRSHLQSPPNVPGTFTGNVSFRVTGQHCITTPARSARRDDRGPLAARPCRWSVAMPAAPGRPPGVGAVHRRATAPTISLPVNRRTLIPSAGGEFDTTITSTVGRQVGQISTFNINVPAGENDLDVSFAHRTPARTTR